MDALTRRYEAYPGMRAFAARGSIISRNDDGTRSVNVDVPGTDLRDIFVAAQAVCARAEQVLGRLPALPLHTPTGTVVPLSALAELVETVDTEELRHVNGRRTVTLNVIPPRDIALETAVGHVQREVVDALLAEGAIPQGVQLDSSGASDQLDATREVLGANFLVALLLCYFLLVAIFTHWGYPLVIMTTVPLGIAGGIVGLALLNVVVRQPFDIITMPGFLIVLSTVVNNPILIVDQARHNLQHGAASVEQAVLDALDSRLRPILMTTVTTVFGLAPLVLIPGAGTELYRGLGLIVLSGLMFATLLTLSFLPVLLTTLLKLRRTDRSATGQPA